MRSRVIPGLIEVGRDANGLVAESASHGPGENRDECVEEDEPQSQCVFFYFSSYSVLGQLLLRTYVRAPGMPSRMTLRR